MSSEDSESTTPSAEWVPKTEAEETIKESLDEYYRKSENYWRGVGSEALKEFLKGRPKETDTHT